MKIPVHPRGPSLRGSRPLLPCGHLLTLVLGGDYFLHKSPTSRQDLVIMFTAWNCNSVNLSEMIYWTIDFSRTGDFIHSFIILS